MNYNVKYYQKGDNNLHAVVCEKCGANDLYEENGYRICRYCRSKFLLTSNDFSIKGSNITLTDDVIMLLQKCKADPRNARKYANLVLDIDPDNAEALKYL
jgi:DNA-directed RNA polymerase subunit RPC12/RpoP